MAVKSFITFIPWVNVIKPFTAVSYKFINKIGCLHLASLCKLVYCLWERPGAYPRVEHLKGVSLG
jgi:hypothetical protein